MPGFDFDKLKDQAEDYIKEHSDQVKKAEQMGQEQLKKVMGRVHGDGAEDGPEDGHSAAHHEGENPA
jgi:hypothetical protein